VHFYFRLDWKYLSALFLEESSFNGRDKLFIVFIDVRSFFQLRWFFKIQVQKFPNQLERMPRNVNCFIFCVIFFKCGSVFRVQIPFVEMLVNNGQQFKKGNTL